MTEFKEKILQSLRERLQQELREAQAAGDVASSLVREGDIKSDGKYDTRGVEASYLAGAQLKRVEELKLELQLLDETPSKALSADEAIAVGALVELLHNQQLRWYFLSTTAGGIPVSIDGQAVLVVSVFSPIGDALLGLKVGEDFELETPQGTRNYLVKKIS